MLPLLLVEGSLSLREVLACRTFWGVLLGAIALAVLLPRRLRHGEAVGGVLAIIAVALLGSDMPLLTNWIVQSMFWVLALVTLGSAVGTLASQSPVHSAIWFAFSLLGTAGLFFLQGSQFLGVATVIVYAGAIVVTLLFVIMLAQPEGHATYDRISWGWFPRAFSVLSAAAMVGVLTLLLSGLKEQALAEPSVARTSSVADTATEQPALTAPVATNPVLAADHMAALGGYLFSRHLINVELAGTLLLAALVGAVAIAIHGRPRSKIEEALR